MSDDRPKRSWREIDSMRDRSTGKPREGGGGGPRGKKAEAQQKSYRAALDRLFEGGGIGKLVEQTEKDKGGAPASESEDSRLKLFAKVRDAIGPDDITRAINAYLKAHPWPQDLDFASAALEHRDDDIIKTALGHIGEAIAKEKPRRAATLVGRLRSLEELSSDEDIRRLAAELRAKL